MGQAGNLGSGQSDVLQQCSLAGAGAEDIVRTPKHSIVAAVDPL